MHGLDAVRRNLVDDEDPGRLRQRRGQRVVVPRRRGPCRGPAFVRSDDAVLAIWWLDGRSPHSLDTPVVGGFVGEVGTFTGSGIQDGTPFLIRFVWRRNPGGNPTWEQAFSADAGASWETNWTMEFVRRGE